ncbi:alpha-amylase family glycosyl hydrolase [Actinomyces sp. B33]|uniref:alpha-amylase family glycosyl hydrolase n=1 Tax=Actinomyces sp. B33 TaxID=2942131 RepID=UPI00234210C3|nr:alpha-amylase family glycosyl hydrolase [Actinomyces sp. B33]MDC4233265.1 alpha-amylase family glycosyl hydrolase [Actinomyces sp. B33]
MRSTPPRVFLPGAVAVVALSALLSTASPSPSAADPAPSPAPASSPGPLAEGDVIYQVVVDRFADGDSSNNDTGNGEYDPQDLGFYHGGDWKGLTDKLDYISGLGVTAIWLSPVSEQQPVSKDGKEGSYHGYFTRDFATPNSHFGSATELQTLIDTAHSKGLKMILDVVPNHTADYLDAGATSYTSAAYQPAPPLNDANYYHHNGDCAFDGTQSQEQIENCDLGGLDDLDQSNPAVSDYLITTYRDWVDMGFDGVRVDAARSVPKPWLKKFEEGLGVPSFGEIFVGDVDYVADYQNYQWGELDFPYFFTVREVFSADTDMRALKTLFDQDSAYVNANRLETFIDNHDRARFLTWANDDYQRLRSALTFLLSSRGVPVIYYGTEQADDGNGNGNEVPIANKDNRKDMPSFDTDATIYRHIQRVTSVRDSVPALKTGTQREMWSDPTVYSFSRRDDASGDEAVIVSTNSWNPQTRTIPIRSESSLPVGTVLVNAMNTDQKATIEKGGATGRQITVTVDGHDTAIYSPIGTIDAYSPSHDTVTTVRVHANVGYGNAIAIRGDAYPFTWSSGRAARWTEGDVWVYETERIPAGTPINLKALVNDSTWQSGDNTVAEAGSVIDIYPSFP